MIMLSWKAPTATQKPPHGCAHSTTITMRLSCPSKSRMSVKRLGFSVSINSSGLGNTHIYVDVCIAMREGGSGDLVLRTVTTDLTCLPTPPVIEISPNHGFLAR